jgi:hypothetical protein
VQVNYDSLKCPYIKFSLPEAGILREIHDMIIGFNSAFSDITERLEKSWPEPTKSGLIIPLLLNYGSEELIRNPRQMKIIISRIHVHWSRGAMISRRWGSRCEGSTERTAAGFDLVGLSGNSCRGYTVGRTWFRNDTDQQRDDPVCRSNFLCFS